MTSQWFLIIIIIFLAISAGAVFLCLLVGIYEFAGAIAASLLVATIVMAFMHIDNKK